MSDGEISGYEWRDARPSSSHSYLLPVVMNELISIKGNLNEKESCRLFELGCGNGSVANVISQSGWLVAGVDPSVEGISHANAHYPDIKLEVGSAYDDLSSKYGTYPVVTSLEVVEHVYFPRKWAATIYDLLDTGGTAIISTPYHGYWKNLVMAITGKLDGHFTALWDHGHIKFWSIKTMAILLQEAGFVDIRFERAGRIPCLAKSMIAIARKP